MTKRAVFWGGLVFVALPAWAQMPILPTPAPIFFEHTPDAWIEQNTPQESLTISPPPTLNLPKLDLNTLTASELQELNMMYAEDLIGMAIVGQQWDILQELLDIYQEMPEFDGILIDYAKGAMFRKQGQQKQAIAHYHKILQKRPELTYVKLDLALMYYENKQYKDSDRLLAELLQTNLTKPVHDIVLATRQNIQKHQSIRPSISVNYEATDNVNNASSEKVISWLGRQWQKDESSLPQSAHGIRYDVGASTEKNIHGNHNLIAETSTSGVYYWDNQDYSEQSIRAQAGYKYADIYRFWSVAPFAEYNWLDGESYNQQIGLVGRYGQPLGQKAQVQLFGSYAHKAYKDDKIANRYDGDVLIAGASASRRLDSNTLIYGGLDSSWDNTKDKELSSVRTGVRAGVVQTFDNGLGLNASARYARRNFDAPASFVYTFVREDDEYQLGLSFWHNRLIYRGFRPQLNIRYLKIDSNMPAFYSRDSLNYFMNIEKTF